MNDDFPVLSFVSFLLKFVGWIVFISGVVLAFYSGLFEPKQPGHYFGTTNMMQLGGCAILIILGLISTAIGEIIGVLFAIELNTRTEDDDDDEDDDE